MNGSISVVIPTYNAARFLRETLESVCAQRRLPEEIVVVDDASTDATADTVRQFARGAPLPLHLQVLPKNSGGPSLPTNVGLESAKGEFIALLDHDDLMLPEKLALQAEALESHAEVDLALSDYEHFGPEGVLPDSDARRWEPKGHPMLFRERGEELQVLDPMTCVRAFVTRPGLALSCSSYFFRSSLWRRVGGFDHRFMPVADYDFLLRAIDRPVAWLDRVLFRKRVHATNHWRTYVAEPSRNWRSERSVARAQRAMLKRFPQDPILRQLVANHTGYVAGGFAGIGEQRAALAETMHLLCLRQPRDALRIFARVLAATLRCR